MKKILLLLFVPLFIFINASAQKGSGSGFGAGVNAGFGVSGFDVTGLTFTVGADIFGQHNFSDEFAATGDVGYHQVISKRGGGADFGIIPIRAGVRFFPGTNKNMYVGAKIGVGILTGRGFSSSTTAYSFGGGYKLNRTLDLGLTYDGYSKQGSIGLINIRFGFTFNTK